MSSSQKAVPPSSPQATSTSSPGKSPKSLRLGLGFLSSLKATVSPPPTSPGSAVSPKSVERESFGSSLEDFDVYDEDDDVLSGEDDDNNERPKSPRSGGPTSPSNRRSGGKKRAARGDGKAGDSQQLSSEDKTKAYEVFDIYSEGGEDDHVDESSKPYLSLAQFGRAVAALGFKLSTEEVEKAFRSLDSDKRGKVSDRKFLLFYEKQLLKHVQESKIRDNFDKLVQACGNLSDTHGEPYIDPIQFRRFLTEYGYKLSDEEAEEMMRECRGARGGGRGSGKAAVSSSLSSSNRIYYHQYRSMLVEHK